MKKKILALTLVLGMAASTTGCNIPGLPGQGGTVGGVEDTTEVTTEATTAAVQEDTTVAATEATEAPTEADTEATTAAPAADRNFEGSFVNFDDMHFFVNGKKYTLGTDTLQTMIDDGVPFNDNDIANAGNNINANYTSQGFKIELGDYYSAQVYVMNDTSENKKMSDCFLCEIYLPVKQDVQQNILSFDFPTDITMDELLAACGEPDENKHWVSDDDATYYTDTIKYKRDSEKYYGSSYYSFEFVKGELEYIYINYMP